jgi:hypothetical protein
MRVFMSYILNLYFRFAFIRQILWAIFALAVFSISAALIFQGSRVSTAPVGWDKSFQISSFNVVARDVSVASRGDIIAAAYEGRAGGVQGIYLSLSFNGGVSFMPPIRVAGVASKTTMNPYPAISPGGDLTVMWHSHVEEETTERIFYAMSKDLGASWTVPKKLELGKEMEMLPRIYYDDQNTLHLFYHGSVGENINLFHAVSKDGEKFDTTGSLIRLTSSMRGAFFPAIHIAGKYFFMVWQGKEEDFSDDLFFMKSSDYGWSWSMKKQITFSTGNNAAPAVVLHDNTLYVVFQNNDEKSWSIKMLRGIDRGGGWEEAPLTVSSTLANCYSPTVGVSGNDLMILWYDTRNRGATIYSRRYSSREKNFLPETEVSEARYESRNPTVVTLGKRLIVFWEERNVIMAKQTDVYAEPPTVFSETNPEGKWSRLPYIVLQWKSPPDESGIVGYAALRNEVPDFNPTVVNLKPNVTMEKITENITDGISYYHIRAVDGAGNFSRTIHYKLQLAVNPLPGPVIVSQTNPQGKPSQFKAPVFNWSVEEPERVKGFIYSMSKDSIKMPDQFTTDMKMDFKDLEEGTYFFSVAAIDKTNQISRVSTYDFIIGAPDRVIDPEYYKKLAEEEKKFQKFNRFKMEYRSEGLAQAQAPFVRIRFPFDIRSAFDKGSFKAFIVANHIRPDSILGYSLYIGDKKRELQDSVNHKGAIIDVKDLHNGSYYIGVKCKYKGVENGLVKEYWTKPYVAMISILVPDERSPVLYYAQRIMEKFPRRFGLITLTFVGLGLVMTTLGFGTRISFYFQLVLFRLRLMFRPLLKKMSG